MIISKLEIENFKSFCDKTVFDFHNGLNVITGANGSGKSNILDSIGFVFIKKDKRVRHNKDFFNNKNNGEVSVVKITTDDNQTVERCLERFSSGHTRSKYYINGKLATKEQMSDFVKQIDTEIIDNCGICMNMADAEKYAQELKNKSQTTQIIAVSHTKPIIGAADKIQYCLSG